MEWYKVLIEVVLGLGGLAGIGAFIKIFMFAKQDKASKNIENKGNEIENLHKIIGDYREELEWFKKEFKEYKEDVDARVAMFKGKFAVLEDDVDHLKRVVSEAYRCTYPPTLDECPVIKAMKASKKCEECRKRGADDCIDCKEEE